MNLQWTAGTLLIALALIAVIVWIGRDRKMRRVKVGFFIERERFVGPPEDDAVPEDSAVSPSSPSTPSSPT